MDSLTKVGFYFFITNYVKHPIPRLHTHEAVRSKTRSDSSVSQGQASAQLHETGPRHSAHPRHLFALFPTSPALYPPSKGRGSPPSIRRRNQTNKGAPPKLYCSTRKAILLYLRSYIGSTPEQYRCAHRTNKLDKPHLLCTCSTSLLACLPRSPTSECQHSTPLPQPSVKRALSCAREQLYINRSVATILTPRTSVLLSA